jgi:hypothetical protein
VQPGLAVHPALAVADDDPPAAGRHRHVLDVEGGQLGHPEAGVEQQQPDRGVAGRLAAAGADEAALFGGVERFGRGLGQALSGDHRRAQAEVVAVEVVQGGEVGVDRLRWRLANGFEPGAVVAHRVVARRPLVSGSACGVSGEVSGSVVAPGTDDEVRSWPPVASQSRKPATWEA